MWYRNWILQCGVLLVVAVLAAGCRQAPRRTAVVNPIMADRFFSVGIRPGDESELSREQFLQFGSVGKGADAVCEVHVAAVRRSGDGPVDVALTFAHPQSDFRVAVGDSTAARHLSFTADPGSVPDYGAIRLEKDYRFIFVSLCKDSVRLGRSPGRKEAILQVRSAGGGASVEFALSGEIEE